MVRSIDSLKASIFDNLAGIEAKQADGIGEKYNDLLFDSVRPDFARPENQAGIKGVLLVAPAIRSVSNSYRSFRASARVVEQSHRAEKDELYRDETIGDFVWLARRLKLAANYRADRIYLRGQAVKNAWPALTYLRTVGTPIVARGAQAVVGAQVLGGSASIPSLGAVLGAASAAVPFVITGGAVLLAAAAAIAVARRYHARTTQSSAADGCSPDPTTAPSNRGGPQPTGPPGIGVRVGRRRGSSQGQSERSSTPESSVTGGSSRNRGTTVAGNGANVTIEAMEEVKKAIAAFLERTEEAHEQLKTALGDAEKSWSDEKFAHVHEQVDEQLSKFEAEPFEELTTYIDGKIQAIEDYSS